MGKKKQENKPKTVVLENTTKIEFHKENPDCKEIANGEDVQQPILVKGEVEAENETDEAMATPVIQPPTDDTGSQDIEEEVSETVPLLTDELQACIKDSITELEMLPETDEIYEGVEEFNNLISELKKVNNQYEELKELVIKINLQYDQFKKDFSSLIEEFNWGDKLYYAFTILDDWKNSPWDNNWCETVTKAVSPDNRARMRAYLNRELNNCVFTLPQGLYFYRLKEEKTEGVKENAVSVAQSFAPRVVQFFKYLLESANSLREPLMSVLADVAPSVPQRLEILSIEKRNTYIQELKSILETQAYKEDMYIEICRALSNVYFPGEYATDNFSLVKESGTELYSLVQNRIKLVESLQKNLYVRSLDNIYKLYEYVTISLDDFRSVEIDPDDKKTENYVGIFINMLTEVSDKLCEYLYMTLNVKPLDVKPGKLVSDYSEEMYEIIGAVDSTEIASDTIESIPHIGFAIFKGDVPVTIFKPAKVIVYKKVK